jgi:hypothetical protein
MDASKEPLGNIEVVVGLNPSLECVVRANDFRARLEQYLDDLLVDLRLPACIELSTMLCQEPDRFPVNRTLYQVRIAGRPCRLELQARTAETIGPLRSDTGTVALGKRRALFPSDVSRKISRDAVAACPMGFPG